MINIKSDEHVFICGKTGSGKTNISKLLWGSIQPGRGLILDVKHELSAYGFVAHSLPEINKILNSGKNAVFQGQNTKENFAAIFDYVYKRGNITTWLDEGFIAVPEGKISEEGIQLYTAGRSRGAIAWTLTQRPAIVSKTAISQSTHYFIFNLIKSQDKKAVCDDIPLQVEDFLTLKPYEFFYYREGMDKAQRCAPVTFQK
jgi:DNA helicase HerA-like ATPase